MKILLVVPRFNTEISGEYYFPLGIAYISTALKQAGHNVTILNLNHSKGNIDELVTREILDSKCQIVATGGLSIYYDMIKAIIDVAKYVSSDLVTVLGGGIITAAPREIFHLIKPTFGIIGEGENTIIELITALENNGPIEEIPGLVFKGEDRHLIQTDKRKSMTGTLVAQPDYEAVGLFKKWDLQLNRNPHAKLVLDLAAARSCPFDCTFCFHPLGRGYRPFDMETVFSLIENMKIRYDFHHLFIVDELFAPKKSVLVEFCKRIKKYRLTWEAQLRVDTVNEEVIRLMKASGCTLISYGIESISQTVLKSMRKKTTTAQVEQALQLTYDADIEIQGNLIFGDEAETMDTFLESLSWWMENRHYNLFLSAIRTYPGAVIYDHAVSRGLIVPMTFLPNGGGIVNITKMSADDFTFMHLATREISDSFLWLCRSCEFHKDSKGIVNQVRVTCPKCGNLFTFDNLQKDDHVLYRTFGRRWWRFICEACSSRFDVPLATRSASGNLENEMLYLMSFADDSGSFYNDLRGLYDRIRRDRIGVNEIRSLGNKLELEGSIREAYVCQSLFLRENPLDADCHEYVATIYDQMGHSRIGDWHRDEAIRLREIMLDDKFYSVYSDT